MNPDLGLLLLRIVVGALLVGHGGQKALGWFGGRARTISAFEGMGYRPAETFVTIAGWVQLAGGALMVLGLLFPIGAALIAGSCVQAIKVAKWKNGLWNQRDGYEYLLVLATVATAMVLTGPGRYAFDLGATVIGPEAGLGLVVVALIAGVGFPRRLPVRR